MSKKENNTSKDIENKQAEETLDTSVENTEETAVETPEEAQETVSETEQLQRDLEKEKDKYLRLFAEFENYKRRTSKERVEQFKTANQEVLQSLLPVLDDFDRALLEIGKSDDKELLQGVELISNKLIKTLEGKGLVLMPVKVGDTFDADLHEAVTQIPAPDKKLKGKIVDVIEKGYTLGERIIRYPKVVTGK